MEQGWICCIVRFPRDPSIPHEKNALPKDVRSCDLLIRANLNELIEHAEQQETIIRQIILVVAKHTSHFALTSRKEKSGN